MAGFDAEKIASDYDYDLREWGGKGRVPMPSLPEVRKFREQAVAADERLEQAIKTRVDALPDDASEADREKAAESTSEERDAHVDALLEAVAMVCNGTPSRDVLTGLPAPILLGFAGWLLGVFAPLL